MKKVLGQDKEQPIPWKLVHEDLMTSLFLLPFYHRELQKPARNRRCMKVGLHTGILEDELGGF